MATAESAPIAFAVAGPVDLITVEGSSFLWFLIVLALVIWGILRFKRDD